MFFRRNIQNNLIHFLSGSMDINYKLIKLKIISPVEKAEKPDTYLGPVVQSVVSLTSSLRVISLAVLVDSIHNILIFFAEKM